MPQLTVERTWAFARIKSVKSYMNKSRQTQPGIYEYYVKMPKFTSNIMLKYGIPHTVQKAGDRVYRIVWTLPKDLAQ